MTPSGRIGIVAGGGDLPERLASHARDAGRDPFVVGLSGFVAPELLQEFGGVDASIGEVGRVIQLLQGAGCRDVVFAGSVRRPDFETLKLDLRGASILPKVLLAARKGDDALLRVIADTFDKAGFNVLGAEDVLGSLLAEEGPLGRHQPSEAHWLDIRRAAEVAAAIGALDIGQGAISCDGLILAVEAQEGTDAMLARIPHLPPAVRGSPDAPRGVLVKRPKPQQERRIDLPTIGASTLTGVHTAGLAGLAVEAGGTLVLDKDGLRKLADELGLFVVGFTRAAVA